MGDHTLQGEHNPAVPCLLILKVDDGLPISVPVLLHAALERRALLLRIRHAIRRHCLLILKANSAHDVATGIPAVWLESLLADNKLEMGRRRTCMPASRRGMRRSSRRLLTRSSGGSSPCGTLAAHGQSIHHGARQL